VKSFVGCEDNFQSAVQLTGVTGSDGQWTARAAENVRCYVTKVRHRHTSQ